MSIYLHIGAIISKNNVNMFRGQICYAKYVSSQGYNNIW